MRLQIVIPSKNISNLRACVAAVRNHEPELEPRFIVVVDDSEGLEIAKLCATENYTWIRGEKPFVYARNCNLGLTFQVSENWEHHPPCGFILLNDDALLESDRGFTTMAEAQAAHPEYGIIGATTKVTGNPNQFPKGVGLRDEPRMVTFVAVYIPRTTLQRVGALDERYVGYGCDDDDYCWMVRKMGLKIGVHDGCYVDHGSLKSTFRGDPKTPADFKPNLALFIQKWGHDNWGRPA